MLITPPAIAALQTGINLSFQQAWLTTPIYWQRLATLSPSTTRSNVYAAMARLPTMREWLGPRLFANITGHDYTLTNRTYELSVGVEREDIEDDQIGWTGPRAAMMGMQAAKWPDQLVREALQSGDTTTGPGGAGFDALSFFNDAHTLDPAGTQDNLLAGTALTASNYGVARETMMSFTGEDSEPMGVMPDLLIVPPQLETEARTILNAEFIADPGGVAAGVTNVFRNTADLLVVPELSGEATTWYLMDTSRPIMPLIWQLRRAVQMTSKTALTDDNVFRNKRFEWGVDARGVVGYGPWFLALQAAA